MSDAPRLHVDPRGRVIVENATAEIMEALAALKWSGTAGSGIRVAASPTRPPAHPPSRVPALPRTRPPAHPPSRVPAAPRTPSEASHRA